MKATDDDAREKAWHDERERCWREFADAADASANGDHDLAFKYAAAHPECAEELRRFVRCLKRGLLVKVAPYTYRHPKRAQS